MTFDLSHTVNRFVLPIANFISSLLPPTRGFAIRRQLYRWAGLIIANDVKIVGGTKFHFSNITIGSETWLSQESHFMTSKTATISIGRCVDIGPGCFFNTGSHLIGGPKKRAGQNVARDIVVGDGTWIGMGSVVLDGASIGSGCVVAAGSVVRDIFPDNVLIGGVPARIIKKLDT